MVRMVPAVLPYVLYLRVAAVRIADVKLALPHRGTDSNDECLFADRFLAKQKSDRPLFRYNFAWLPKVFELRVNSSHISSRA